jgi:outer membrane protein OmpA-like peptidoglycan-associated protein
MSKRRTLKLPAYGRGFLDSKCYYGVGRGDFDYFQMNPQSMWLKLIPLKNRSGNGGKQHPLRKRSKIATFSPWEATPATPATPSEQTPTGQAHSESQTQTLRKKVVEFYANSDLLTTKGRGTINSLLFALRNNPRTHVEIAGHADNVGTQDYNLALSQRRVEAVKKHFIAQEIAEPRLIAPGYGFSLPIADNATAEGKQRNRRAEVIVHSSAAGS